MTTKASGTGSPAYLMGRSEAETRRLIAQHQLYARFTRRLLEDAGIAEGMKVLDVGSGAGDVALLAAELVGPTGMVLGVDQDPGVLETASARLDRALARLEASVRSLNGRMRARSRIEADTQKLLAERALGERRRNHVQVLGLSEEVGPSLDERLQVRRHE